MKAVDNILFPIDFNDLHQPLIDYAVGFIQRGNLAKVTFLSIEDELDKKQKVIRDQQIARITNGYSDKVKDRLRWVSKSGGVKDTILTVRKEIDADMIMMGTRGSNNQNDFTLASELVLDANCSVLVIPKSIQNIELKKIALTIGNDVINNHKSLLVLFAISRLFNAEVHVLTVQGQNMSDKEAQQKNDDLLDYYLENLFARHSFSINSDIEQGIFDYVKNYNIDMLAIIPNNHAVKGVKSEGRLTKVLTLHTQVPLLTLNP